MQLMPTIELNFFVLWQVNPVFVSKFEEKGLKFVGQDVDGERMEILELEGERS